VSERCDVEKPACVGNLASVTECIILLMCLRMGLGKAQCCVSATLFHWSLLSTLRDFLVRPRSRELGCGLLGLKTAFVERKCFPCSWS
jgi:hypothetical protein